MRDSKFPCSRRFICSFSHHYYPFILPSISITNIRSASIPDRRLKTSWSRFPPKIRISSATIQRAISWTTERSQCETERNPVHRCSVYLRMRLCPSIPSFINAFADGVGWTKSLSRAVLSGQVVGCGGLVEEILIFDECWPAPLDSLYPCGSFTVFLSWVACCFYF